MSGLEAFSILPINKGKSHKPMFCIQKISAYAEPMILLSTNLGTDGHNDAGTNEKLAPRIRMVTKARVTPPISLFQNLIFIVVQRRKLARYAS